jgi:hypothetical protein
VKTKALEEFCEVKNDLGHPFNLTIILTFFWSDDLRRRALGRHIRRWEDNARMNFRDICREAVDWIRLAQDRNQWQAVVYTIIKLRVQ